MIKVLEARQAKVDGGSEVSGEWGSFRRLKAYGELRECLLLATGWRNRCSYCSDSLAADVEHFFPKEKYPRYSFQFGNMLIVCPICNRKKSSSFPCSEDGLPLLINPLVDDPWDSLFFTPETGLITARVVDVQDGTPIFSIKGATTMEVLGKIINSEPIREARRRSWGNLVGRLFEIVMGSAKVQSVAEAFDDIDDYGLAEWIFFREGKEDPEIARLRKEYSAQWELLRELPRK